MLWILLAIGIAGYGVRCVRHGRWEPPKPGATAQEERHRDRGTDFTAYYSAGELARKGENIYDWRASSTPRRPFIYPPLFAVFPMAPLSLLPHNAALGVYYAINVALLLGLLWLLRKLLWPAETEAESFWRQPAVGLLLAVLICGRFLDSNFVLGQANLFVAFLASLGLYLMARGKTAGSGWAIALATTFKVTPGLFGLYFLWTRRGWAMLGGALGLAVFLLVLPGFWLGFERNLELLDAYLGHVTKRAAATEHAESESDGGEGDDEDAIEIGWGGDFEAARAGPKRGVGIALRGTLLKLLTEPPPPPASHARKDKQRPAVNIAALDPAWVVKLAAVLALLVLGTAVALTAPKWARAGPEMLALSWGLVAAAMLLISPLTRKAHAVVLLIPAVALIALLQRGLLQGAARKAAWAALVFLGSAGLLSSPEIAGDEWSEVLHSAGLFTWATLGLFAAAGWALWSRRAAAIEAGQSSAGTVE